MLLVVDLKIDGIYRERLMVSYYRYRYSLINLINPRKSLLLISKVLEYYIEPRHLQQAGITLFDLYADLRLLVKCTISYVLLRFLPQF